MTPTAKAATFRGWLAAQRHRGDPVGDLARDAFQGDTACPDGCQFTGGRAFLSHLVNEHDPCEGALDAAYRARREYRALFAGRGARDEGTP